MQNDSKIILDVVDTEDLPALQFQKYIDVLNVVPTVAVYLVLLGNMRYDPELFRKCNMYGIGTYLAKGSNIKEILRSKPRAVEQLASMDQLAIIPGASYGNLLSFRKCCRRFRKYVYWLERNLPKKSIEILYESVKDGDIKGVKKIHLLRGIDDKVNKTFRDDFKRFQDEIWADYDISAEMRILIDRTIAGQIHGRYMYSMDASGRELRIQLPPLNSMRGDQWDTIYTDVQVIPPFTTYWKSGKDIITGWNAVERAVTKHIQNKSEEADLIVVAKE